MFKREQKRKKPGSKISCVRAIMQSRFLGGRKGVVSWLKTFYLWNNMKFAYAFFFPAEKFTFPSISPKFSSIHILYT